MLEVLFLVLIVILVMSGIFFYSGYRDKKVLEDAEREVVSVKERLKIAERKYMQGKIRKGVFDSIMEDLEAELLSYELLLFRLKKSGEVSVDDKTNQIVDKLVHPTKYRTAKIEKILKDSEITRRELSMLEAKLMKHEISQNVFEKIVKQKESELISKEKELMDLVIKSSQENAPRRERFSADKKQD
ncbi:MAG: hypothetical protein WCW44_06170 [archaeon]|jgi:hypothetical protein